MDIKKSLIKYLEKNPPKDTDSIDEDELFLHEYAAVHLEPPKGIPTFYYPSGLPEHPLACRLREEARAKILKRKENELINNTELKNLWTLLDSHASSTKENDDKYLTYHDYKRVRKESDPKVQSFLSSRLYLTLAEESSGRLLVATLFDYIMRKTWLLQTRIELSLYDKDGSGFLEETDLETYLGELIHTLPKLDILEKSFHPFYICTAVRKFYFFLDPIRTGKIKIRDILASGFLDDFLELRDQEAGKDLQESNWFSGPSVLRIYGQYLNLDNDHNGMLSPSELKNYGTGTLTDTFIQRVFQECLTYDSEMDYKTYIDFVLAFENRKSPQSLRYFFRILDIKQQGYLDHFTLNYFFKDILKEMDKLKQEPVLFEDVMDEIFDMISPKDPNRITLQDLVNSKQGNTIISILIDLNGFWCHESREDYITEEDEVSSDN
ncbi:serine/threonine-protein phosphatase 2A regulatory subunit B'' subunit gamma isoform X2 [Lepeophtheirus salmonis]|uniref:serine/threonine-protein phosphatase 2A regulatory subunit B'' subunit gamma isoform X2 n=1 Tax=Lepeophtheirus salmonis TaxID=72036 RepID=UPI001AE45E83|nr:serine/threonine-protein phosphatase 2A regulatory subunit B'' subunit gamma-like isoform X2 [Lepeophtheirus salmonis]